MHFTAFKDRSELARWLAQDVASRLDASVSRRGQALLAVSGGTTPSGFFRELSNQEIDWRSVCVTLVDERFVPPNSSRSNQRMVTFELLQNKAAKARLQPLYSSGNVEDAAASASEVIAPMLPADVVVLGMGTDGHTASLFPGADRLYEATNLEGSKLFLPINATNAGEPRITMTLPVIVTSKSQYLHIEGAEKRQVFEQAQEPGDPATMPIRHVLEHCPDLRVVWAE